MATRARFAWLAQYSREFSEAFFIFLKNGLWRMSASLASLTHFRKRPFWRVLEFAKFAGEWPFLSFSPKWIRRGMCTIYSKLTNKTIFLFFPKWIRRERPHFHNKMNIIFFQMSTEKNCVIFSLNKKNLFPLFFSRWIRKKCVILKTK